MNVRALYVNHVVIRFDHVHRPLIRMFLFARRFPVGETSWSTSPSSAVASRLNVSKGD